MNILLTLAYDGTKYFGWQKQNNVITVQESVEKALSKFLDKNIEIVGASRTDTGVHALDQKAMFKIEKINIPIKNLPYPINNLLPPDIRVQNAEIVDESFHPQYKAKNKTYRYKVYNKKFENPILHNYIWHIYNYLDLEKIKKASEYIIGEHDFTAFCASGSSTKINVRQVNSLDIFKEDDIIYFDINGNGFLYNMVRIIVGTLIYVGYGKIEVEDIPIIINSLDRAKAGKTAPAKGLTLMKINY